MLDLETNCAIPPVYSCWRFGPHVLRKFLRGCGQKMTDMTSRGRCGKLTNAGAAKNCLQRGVMIQRSKQMWSDC